jgi:vacuolar-type H+-ATPase subunit B/Vma2
VIATRSVAGVRVIELSADRVARARTERGHVRDLASIIGTAALGQDDQRYLAFASDFEQRFVHLRRKHAIHTRRYLPAVRARFRQPGPARPAPA